GVGSCGTSHGDGEYVVAVLVHIYNSYPGATPNPNKNPICKRYLRVNYKGKSITVWVVDKCYKCGANDIDLSRGAFGALAGLGSKPLTTQWHFTWAYHCIHFTLKKAWTYFPNPSFVELL
ncbi:hypothetical protein BD779DRAFT_1449483, partial [Infundibulicybe gibba]